MKPLKSAVSGVSAQTDSKRITCNIAGAGSKRRQLSRRLNQRLMWCLETWDRHRQDYFAETAEPFWFPLFKSGKRGSERVTTASAVTPVSRQSFTSNAAC